MPNILGRHALSAGRLARLGATRALHHGLLGRLGAALLHTHFAFDAQRFMAPPAEPEDGYAWFLGTQLRDPDVCILVAADGGDVVGYVYAALEPHSWKELRDAAVLL